MEKRTRNGVAGLLGAGVALGIGELLAGMFEGIASPLASIGGVVVDRSPSWAKDFAISVFGTADKAALAVGTAVIALIIGWIVAARFSSQRWPVPLVFAVFGLLGALAALDEVGAVAWMVFVAAVVAVAAGWVAYELIRRAGAMEDPTDGLADDRSRRRFLTMATAAGVAAVGSGWVGRRLIARVPPTPDVDISAPRFPAPTVGSANEFDLDGLTPIVVPNDEFYRIDTALVIPRVEPADWSLRIHGLVDREVSFSYDDLLGMDLVEDYVTLSCVSNQVGGDLVGNALWTGVRLEDLLERAGAPTRDHQVVGRSLDDFTVGFPSELGFDGRSAMVALAMNGEPLPRSHGFPARLVVAGLYGYVSATKWLSDIELTTWDGFDAYWIPRGWSKLGPVKTQSRIDLPEWGAEVPAGPTTVAGVAWDPGRGIEAVEISVDGGEWMPTELTVPLSSHSWVQWRTTADLTPGRHQVHVRATDGTGRIQTAELGSPRPDGATGHDIAIVTGV